MSSPSFWSTFFPTLSGAALGAGVGVLGLWAVFKSESKERYEHRIEDSLVRVNYEIICLLSKDRRSILPKSGKALREELLRENKILSLSFLTVAAIARNDDLKMVLIMQDACLNDENGTLEKQFKLLMTLAASIGGWRAQIREFDFYFNNVKAFAETGSN